MRASFNLECVMAGRFGPTKGGVNCICFALNKAFVEGVLDVRPSFTVKQATIIGFIFGEPELRAALEIKVIVAQLSALRANRVLADG